MCKGRGRQSLSCELMSGLQKGSMAVAMLKETRSKICGVGGKFLERNKEYGPRDREMWVQICTQHLLAVRVWKNCLTSRHLTLLICQMQVNEASLCICLRDSVKQRVWMVGVTPSPSPLCGVTAHWAGLPPALQFSQLGAGRELRALFLSFSLLPQRAANVMDKHLTAFEPHLVSIGPSVCLRTCEWPTLPTPRHAVVLACTFMVWKIWPTFLWPQCPTSSQAECWQYLIQPISENPPSVKLMRICLVFIESINKTRGEKG